MDELYDKKLSEVLVVDFIVVIVQVVAELLVKEFVFYSTNCHCNCYGCMSLNIRCHKKVKKSVFVATILRLKSISIET